MNLKLATLLLLFSAINALYAQEKKKVDHTAYDSWNSISAVQQSKTGSIITYEINPQIGDGNLYIQNIDGSLKKSFNRADDAAISYDEDYIVFFIRTGYDSIRALKLDKVKEKDFPKDTLAIYTLSNDSLAMIPNVDSYKISEKGDWMAYLSTEDEREDCPEKKCRLFKKKNKCEKPETSGTTLHILNPSTQTEKIIHQVVDYEITEKGDQLVYVTSAKGESDSLSLYHLGLLNWDEYSLISNQLKIDKIKFDDAAQQMVFMHSLDTNKLKNYTLSYWQNGMERSEILIDSTNTGMPERQTISINSYPYFSKDGKKLFIGTNEIVRQEPEDTLLDSEKAVVDIWNGFDSRIQPQQLNEKRRDERKTFLAVYHIDTKSLIPLEDEIIDGIRTVKNGNGNIALGYSNIAYERESTWEFPWKKDIYLIDLTNGERELLQSGQAYGSSLSPTGDKFVWYSGIDSCWYGKDVKTNKSLNLTKKFEAMFAEDNNGNPFVPYSEGAMGWTLIDGEEYYLVNSRYDLWVLNPTNPDKSFSLTNQSGKENDVVYRYTRFDYDSTYTAIEANLIHGKDDLTKSESYHKIKSESLLKNPALEGLITSEHKFVYITKADEADAILFRRMNFTDYPELESSNIRFESPKILTETNPQQSEYNWGTVEMINWKSFEGRELNGLLYKPEDFDSTKSYPMIVYFYEKYSNDIHNHYVPKPTASIVYPTEYVSNGYIIFIPDIEYTPGHPAKSAYDCIVSGTDYLTEKHSWIDSTKLGLQGQSWGGYQTAQLITMTTKYKAAMAGAPVSNMFSAYGGIRWGSGLSRMFQYERTQSRIGYTIWEKPELYVENSPIFGLNKVKTPLLIMHNDGDGAVPWYQGIELYMGLRRLDQPVWLLNYNGDEHNLMQTANRKDLSIRMRQFFDYYLLGANQPIWMSEGVPAIDKGKDYGLELKNSN